MICPYFLKDRIKIPYSCVKGDPIFSHVFRLIFPLIFPLRSPFLRDLPGIFHSHLQRNQAIRLGMLGMLKLGKPMLGSSIPNTWRPLVLHGVAWCCTKKWPSKMGMIHTYIYTYIYMGIYIHIYIYMGLYIYMGYVIWWNYESSTILLNHQLRKVAENCMGTTQNSVGLAPLIPSASLRRSLWRGCFPTVLGGTSYGQPNLLRLGRWILFCGYWSIPSLSPVWEMVKLAFQGNLVYNVYRLIISCLLLRVACAYSESSVCQNWAAK